MTRRELLLLPGVCSLFGEVISSSEPQNFTFPLESVSGSITPADRFFARDHFREPELLLSTWRLKIEGRVERPLEVTLPDILESPTKQLEALLECAGGPADGTAAGNAVWEGVPLANILGQAGIARDAQSLMLEGADSGRLMQGSPELPYCQIVSLEKCLRPESLLAFRQNGQFLARRRGFPVRALFPGWYGMDSVKWLQRMVVLGPGDVAPNFEASGMSKLYNRLLKQPSGVSVTRLSEVLVKSAIAWPPDHSKLPAGKHVVRGFAWTGTGLVRRVELSADAGAAWAPAEFEAPPKPFTWVRWKYAWSAGPGEHVLMSRATDDAGRQQPLQRDHARKDGYEMNYCLPVNCSVR